MQAVERGRVTVGLSQPAIHHLPAAGVDVHADAHEQRRIGALYNCEGPRLALSVKQVRICIEAIAGAAAGSNGLDEARGPRLHSYRVEVGVEDEMNGDHGVPRSGDEQSELETNASHQNYRARHHHALASLPPHLSKSAYRMSTFGPVLSQAIAASGLAWGSKVENSTIGNCTLITLHTAQYTIVIVDA